MLNTAISYVIYTNLHDKKTKLRCRHEAAFARVSHVPAKNKNGEKTCPIIIFSYTGPSLLNLRIHNEFFRRPFKERQYSKRAKQNLQG